VAGQADHGGPPGRAGRRHGEVLDEGVKGVREAPVPVQEVEDLVEQDQHAAARRLEDPVEGLRPGGGGLGGRPEFLDPLVPGQPVGQVDPRRLAAGPRVPGVAHEDRHTSLWDLGDASLVEQGADAVEGGGLGPAAGQVVEGGEGVGLAAAELGDKGQHRGGVLRPARQPPQHHAQVLAQGPGEAGAAEELGRVAVVLRGGAGHHLLQVDGELVRVEGPAFADFLTGADHFVPRFHEIGPTRIGCVPSLLPENA
jgi:hypothetical protein